MHTVLLSPESNLLWPLSAVCPWLSLCKLILEHLYLVLPDTLTHTLFQWDGVLWLGQPGCTISCNAAHWLAHTCYCSDGGKPQTRGRNDCSWRAGVRMEGRDWFVLSPPAHCCYCECQTQSAISDLFMWSGGVVKKMVVQWIQSLTVLSLLFISFFLLLS